MKTFILVFKNKPILLFAGMSCVFLLFATLGKSQELATVSPARLSPSPVTDHPRKDQDESKTLAEVLTTLEQAYQVSIVGESRLLQDKYVPNEEGKEQNDAKEITIEDQLLHILQPLGLSFIRYGNSFVIQSIKPSSKTLKKMVGKRLNFFEHPI